MREPELLRTLLGLESSLNHALAALVDLISDLHDEKDPTEPEPPDPDEWKFSGTMGAQAEVLGAFQPGTYEVSFTVQTPKDLHGKKKDIRLFLFDLDGLGRGKDPEEQYHVEHGAQSARLFRGSHTLGWPGVLLQEGPPRFEIDEDVFTHMLPFHLIAGETVTHDRGRVTSPAGTTYSITLRKIG